MSFQDSIREQVTARVTELKLELAQTEKLLATLDEVGSTTGPVKKREEAKKVGEKPKEKAELKATSNGGESNLKAQIEHLLEEGLKPKEIVEATGAKVGYVYLVKRQLAEKAE